MIVTRSCEACMCGVASPGWDVLTFPPHDVWYLCDEMARWRVHENLEYEFFFCDEHTRAFCAVWPEAHAVTLFPKRGG